MKKKINLAVVGCGSIFKKHFIAIYKNRKLFNIIEACDTNFKNFKNFDFDSFNNVNFFTNYNNFIKNSKADLIVLCTPNSLHFSQSMKALEYNKNVLTEKPMSLNYKQSNIMVKNFNKKKLKLYVLMQIRMNPIIIKLKKAIDRNIFGEIKFVNLNVIWNRSQNYYDSADWRGTKTKDGGIFLNQTSHYLDLLVYLFGLPKNINTYTSKTRKNIQVEDTGVVNLVFKNLALGSFNATMLNNFGNLETSFTLVGTKGSVKIGGLLLNKVIYFRSEFEKKFNFSLSKEERNYFSKPFKGHEFFYKNLYDSFIGKNNEISFGHDCLNTMKFIDEIYSNTNIINTK